MKLQIITPGAPQGSYAVYLTAMIHSLMSKGFPPPGIQNPIGSDLVAVRTAGLIAALKAEPTHILWIDSDITFPPFLAQTLMERDVDVVACNVMFKDFTGTPYATNAVVPNPDRSDQVTSVGKTGVESVKRIGLGVMMTKADVYYRIKFPWFGHKWYHKNGSGWSYRPYDGDGSCLARDDIYGLDTTWRSSFEDWWLAERFEDAGITMWLDHDVSPYIGHRGSCVFYQHGAGPG